jgi:uncharacterized protein YxeA
MKRTIVSILIVVVALAGAAFILKNNKAKMHEQTALAKKVNATVQFRLQRSKKKILAAHLSPLAHSRHQNRFWW